MKKAIIAILIISITQFVIMTILSFSIAGEVTLPQIWNVIITVFCIITLFPLWLMIWGVILRFHAFLPYFWGLGFYCLVYGSVVYVIVKRIVLVIKRRKLQN